MKRNVFSCFLKEAREVAVLTLVGRLFHARAAEVLFFDLFQDVSGTDAVAVTLSAVSKH